MTAEDERDLLKWLEGRKKWAKFEPLVNCKNFSRVSKPTKKCLDADIIDTYHDLKMRKIDVIDKQSHVAELRKFLLSANLEEYMTSIDSLPNNSTVYKIINVQYIPSACVNPRNIKCIKVFIEVELRELTPTPSTRRERSMLEDRFCLDLSQYIEQQDEFEDFLIDRDLETFKMFTADFTMAYHIGFSYDGIVPNTVITSMFYRACTTFCPHLEPLVFFWQSVMSEVWIDDYARRLFEPKWMAIEKTALLVIFFLQNCQLIPNIMRETDVFLRSNVTWDLVKKWDEGEPFFSKEYYKQKRDAIAKSPFFEKSVGQLFVALIDFYIYTIPIGNVAIELDRGCVGISNHMEDVPIYTVMQWTCLLDPVFREKINIFRQMLSAMCDYLSTTRDSTHVLDKLHEIRYQVQSDNKEEWEVFVSPDYSHYDSMISREDEAEAEEKSETKEAVQADGTSQNEVEREESDENVTEKSGGEPEETETGEESTDTNVTAKPEPVKKKAYQKKNKKKNKRRF